MSESEFIQAAEKRAAKNNQITEANIEDAFVAFAKRNGCKALKLVFLARKGFPDRTVLCPGGRVLFIEFKRKGKKQTYLQKEVQEMLGGFGFEYHVCDEKGQAEQILKLFLKRACNRDSSVE